MEKQDNSGVVLILGMFGFRKYVGYRIVFRYKNF